MAHALAELLHELPRLRREFEASRQLAAQAVNRAKRLTAQSLVSRQVRFNAARELTPTQRARFQRYLDTLARRQTR